MFSIFDTTHPRQSQLLCRFFAFFLYFSCLFCADTHKEQNNLQNAEFITYQYQFDENQKKLVLVSNVAIQNKSPLPSKEGGAHIFDMKETEYRGYIDTNGCIIDEAHLISWIVQLSNSTSVLCIHIHATIVNQNGHDNGMNACIYVKNCFNKQGFSDDYIMTTMESCITETISLQNSIHITLFFSDDNKQR